MLTTEVEVHFTYEGIRGMEKVTVPGPPSFHTFEAAEADFWARTARLGARHFATAPAFVGVNTLDTPKVLYYRQSTVHREGPRAAPGT